MKIKSGFLPFFPSATFILLRVVDWLNILFIVIASSVSYKIQFAEEEAHVALVEFHKELFPNRVDTRNRIYENR